MKVALTGTTGKIGGSVLTGILKYNLISPKDLILCTSTPTSSKLAILKEKHPSLSIRKSSYDDPSSMVEAFSGCQKLFLVSTPHIAMDYNSAPPGQGREKHHIAAIRAAIEAGVEHIYYTSLAFGSPSKAGVMVAHIRTEAFLKTMNEERGTKYTIIKEGLYNESWPLYFGHFLTDFKGEGEGEREGEGGRERKEVIVAGDGLISWTGIQDLGVASALIIAEDGEKYDGKTLYLSSEETKSLKEIAGIVSDVKGSEIRLKVVKPEEYVRYYEEKGMERANLEWWVSSYAALENGECDIKDRSFTELLASRGVKAKSIEETIKDMLGKK